MPAKLSVPREGDLVEVSVFSENERDGSIFLVMKKAKNKKCVWAKLLACRSTDTVQLWQADGVPAHNLQLKFGSTLAESADRAPGQLEYVKTCATLIPALSKFSSSTFAEFGKEQIESMRVEYDNVNDMLEVEPSRSPSPQAGLF